MRRLRAHAPCDKHKPAKHWTLILTSSYSKTFVFHRPHEYDRSPLYSLESVYKNLPNPKPENAVYVWTGGANGEKSLRFRKYADTCGRSLNGKMQPIIMCKA